MMDILLVDDEALARERLQRLLEDVAHVRVVGEAADGLSALHLARELKPDVVLLDVQMPGLDGLETGRRLAESEQSPAVIFCTAYDQYALEAFSASASDYLLKPVRKEKLVLALQRAGQINRAQMQTLEASPTKAKGHIVARTHTGTKLIAVDDVYLFLADQKYVTVVHKDGENLISDSLKELEAALGNRFIRIHRNALVAVDQIVGIVRDRGGFSAELRSSELRPQISRRQLGSLREIIPFN